MDTKREQIKALYKKLEAQEKELTYFQSFSKNDAWKLGSLIVAKATEMTEEPLAVEITVNGLNVFRCYPEGATKDNERWIQFKRNVVELWEMTSYRAKQKLLLEGNSLQQLKCDPNAYGAEAGAFPICIEKTGMIGTIATSGCSGTLDHDIVVAALEEYHRQRG